MRVLIADDDGSSRLLVDNLVTSWGHEPVVVTDGLDAWTLLQERDASYLAILDWMMPGLSGPEVCRRVRAQPGAAPRYLILLTAQNGAEHLAEGLSAGADDYLRKPFDHRELKARMQVGERVIKLEIERRARIAELEAALAEVRTLQGLLPICSYCRKVRDRGDYWQKLEQYIDANTGVRFSHGICPECAKTEFDLDVGS